MRGRSSGGASILSNRATAHGWGATSRRSSRPKVAGGASGTAIINGSRVEGVYRAFAREAAERGWLRLHLLELDGEPLAGDYSCVLGGREFLLKTGFDEDRARLSPGLLLRWQVLRHAIESGLSSYDFLGGPDAYKLRWTERLRPRVTIRPYRGIGTTPALLYRGRMRPALKQTRSRLPGGGKRARPERAPLSGRAGSRTDEGATPPPGSPAA